MSLKNCRSGDRIEPPGYCFLFVNPGGDFIGWGGFYRMAGAGKDCDFKNDVLELEGRV